MGLGNRKYSEVLTVEWQLFDALQCPNEWKVGFTVFYLKDKANLW